MGNVTGSWSIVACCNSWVMVPFPHPYVDRYFTLLPFCVFLAKSICTTYVFFLHDVLMMFGDASYHDFLHLFLKRLESFSTLDCCTTIASSFGDAVSLVQQIHSVFAAG